MVPLCSNLSLVERDNVENILILQEKIFELDSTLVNCQENCKNLQQNRVSTEKELTDKFIALHKILFEREAILKASVKSTFQSQISKILGFQDEISHMKKVIEENLEKIEKLQTEYGLGKSPSAEKSQICHLKTHCMLGLIKREVLEQGTHTFVLDQKHFRVFKEENFDLLQ